jgi:hypothetical protein
MTVAGQQQGRAVLLGEEHQRSQVRRGHLAAVAEFLGALLEPLAKATDLSRAEPFGVGSHLLGESCQLCVLVLEPRVPFLAQIGQVALERPDHRQAERSEGDRWRPPGADHRELAAELLVQRNAQLVGGHPPRQLDALAHAGREAALGLGQRSQALTWLEHGGVRGERVRDAAGVVSHLLVERVVPDALDGRRSRSRRVAEGVVATRVLEVPHAPRDVVLHQLEDS